MSEIFEVVIFTASLSQYAIPLIKRLDKHSHNFDQLYREHCTFHKGMYFVKDLTKLGRDMKDVIIIDNSPSAYLFQPENAIAITSWYHTKTDRELYKLVPFLTNLAEVDDVRKYLSKSKSYSSPRFKPPGSPKSAKIHETPKTLNVSKSARTLFKNGDNSPVSGSPFIL
jgi:RNA polymerase II subunit A small phosphatase-like protein